MHSGKTSGSDTIRCALAAKCSFCLLYTSVKDFSVIENDPEVDIVVETIGGAKIALDFTTRALKAGKSVVTSNKELVATHGYELLQLAKEHGVSYLFEASAVSYTHLRT